MSAGRGLEPVIRLERVDSTNEEAWRREASAPDGLVIVAREQTAGRGRFGRSWHSPAGGLWMSVLWREPDLPPERTPLVPVAAALAARDAAAMLGATAARIRFPNDIVVEDRKMCGILVESRRAGVYVLGIGWNVNVRGFPEDLTDAVSLVHVLGREVPLERAEAALREALRARRRDLRDPERCARDWRAASALRGRAVRLRAGAEDLRGTVEDEHPLRGIRLRLEDGTVRTVRAEHVADVRPLQPPAPDSSTSCME